ncbi:hypothetical protein BGX27_001550 [Mortierella sp. AM989]|nr:hypothetical protein BGX27_001550 [Mortierella sp. AM989]
MTSGSEITRKSKFAFKLSLPEHISHQHQNHVFFLDTAQSLENWTFAIQIHINQAIAALYTMAEASVRLGQQLRDENNGQSGAGTIIDRVLDRLQLEDPTLSDMGDNMSPHQQQQQRRHQQQQEDPKSPNPRLPPKFLQTYEDNNDTWSTSSSIHNTSSNTSSNLEYIFAANQQSQLHPIKSSMESMREQQQQHLQAGISESQPSHNGNVGSNSGHIGGYGNADQLSVSNSSPATSTIDSPYTSPALKSQSHLVLNNAQGSGYGIPPSPRTFYRVLGNSKGTESIDSSTSISSLASSVDASTVVDHTPDSGHSPSITESGHGSKQSGGNLFMGLVSGGKHRKEKEKEKEKGKEKEKEKERHAPSSTSSSNSGSNGGRTSPTLKLFSFGNCWYNGCSQPAKSCQFHNKNFLTKSPKKSKEKEVKKPKKLWPGSDKNHSQGALSATTSSDRSASPVSTLVSPKPSHGRLASKSMTSLSRDKEFEFESKPMPQLSNPLLSIIPTPIRRRSPSVSVVDDALMEVHQQQRQKRQAFNSAPIQQQLFQESQSTGTKHLQSQTPPPLLSAAPKQPLPPTPPHAVTADSSNSQPLHVGKDALSRNMGLQEFGVTDKSKSVSTVLGGNLFMANHHRTMQKLQSKQSRKSQTVNNNNTAASLPSTANPMSLPSTPVQTSFSIDQQRFQILQQQQQQQQESLYLEGVSRHIIAPDELALAIEQEAEEMRKQQAQEKEAQRNRPTSMINNQKSYQALQTSMGLLTVSEFTSDSGVAADNLLSGSVGQLSQSNSAQGQGNAEGERIISCQEQLACGSLIPGFEMSPVERQRSPISGITSAPIPPRPDVMFPNLQQFPISPSLTFTATELSTVAGGVYNSTTANNSGYHDSLSTTSPAFGHSRQQQSQGSQSQKQVRPPMHPRGSTFDGNREYPTRSLPPPKRHVPSQSELLNSDSFKAYTQQRGGVIRRSSAAAAVSTPSTPSMTFQGDGGSEFMESSEQEAESINEGGLSNAFSSSSMSEGLRPAYMTRRNSSSPVLIRLIEQGGQNISPLIGIGASRTFMGDSPSNDVRRPSLTPTTSPSGSSFSASTVSSTLCSFVDSSHAEQHEGATAEIEEQHHAGLALGMFTPTHHTPSMLSPTSESIPASPIPLNNSSKFKSILSPLASATPISGNSPSQSPSGSPSPAAIIKMKATEGFERGQSENVVASESQDAQNDGGDDKIDVPVVVVNGAHSVNSSHRNMLRAAQSFVFPAPSSTSTTNEQPSSSRSSIDYFNSAAESSGASTPNGEDCWSPGSPGMPASALRAHAVALDLYPGLRKLSLFTAAIGGHPPPALINGRRKGSGGSASARDRKMSTASSFSKMESDEDHDEYDDGDNQSVDLHHDEDWAGNLKSLKGVSGSNLLPGASNKRRPSLPASLLSSSMTRLSTPPPSVPLPLLPHELSQKPRTPPLPQISQAPLRVLPDVPGTAYTSQLKPPPSPSTNSAPNALRPTTPVSQSPLNASSNTPPPFPPVIPRRSPQRSTPSSPTTGGSPRAIQQILTIDHEFP